MAVRKAKRKSAKKKGLELPPAGDWRTTDADEILRRRVRAREEKFLIKNTDPRHPVFSTFEVQSQSGLTYQVEVRDVQDRTVACTCPDFRTAGLGTCKHAEAVWIWLRRRAKAEIKLAETAGSPMVDIVPRDGSLRVERNIGKLSPRFRGMFTADGVLAGDPEEAVAKLSRSKTVRISQEVEPFLASRRHAAERKSLRRDYEAGVVEGRYPSQVTLHPLYPYQREGMLHLAFAERALLADEMGLGKTIQAVAACALLHHLGKARRVLVVTPASLKAEWEEQIRRFTTLDQRLVYGPRSERLKCYADPAPSFFTIVNYEQVVSDSLDINHHLHPDIVVLDEAQRIKNWATKTARAAKRLQSRYAFVLTGTPIENRIDELYSIVDFLDPTLLGPLFRFNREFYSLDERGRPQDYKNLAALRDRVKPVLLRRRKREVETELPERSDRNHFVRLTPAMREEYDEVQKSVSRLVHKSLSRPLTKDESDLLMILLGMLRMICDSPSIIKNRSCDDCPKLGEIARILDEVLSDPDVKVIIFSEWEKMLLMVRRWADKNKIGYAWHTGSVPQEKRRGQIHAFREDPGCRLFLSTDSGGVGLNLQDASVVINCDLPWNPARLEQRIARAWRKHQKRPVTVVNLVAENTIEHQMLDTLATKSNLSEGLLDGSDESLAKTRLKGGREAQIARLRQILNLGPGGRPEVAKPRPVDPAIDFAGRVVESIGAGLAHCQEAMVLGQTHSVILTVVRDIADTSAITSIFQAMDWHGRQPELRVLDQATWEALQVLAASGLVTFNARAVRPLVGEALPPPPKPTLTREQQQRVNDLRAIASRKEKAARVLAAEGLEEEAEPHRKAAAKATEEAEKIEDGRG